MAESIEIAFEADARQVEAFFNKYMRRKEAVNNVALSAIAPALYLVLWLINRHSGYLIFMLISILLLSGLLVEPKLAQRCFVKQHAPKDTQKYIFGAEIKYIYQNHVVAIPYDTIRIIQIIDNNLMIYPQHGPCRFIPANAFATVPLEDLKKLISMRNPRIHIDDTSGKKQRKELP